MNKVILMGRLVREPEIRYSQATDSKAIARFTLAVDRRRRDEETIADFITCVAFNKQAEFCEKYVHKGTKLIVTGRISTGNYTNKEGQKIYTTEVMVEELEFSESKKDSNGTNQNDEGFQNVPDGFENLPFN